MRTDRLRIAALCAVGLFGFGMVASGCAPRPGTTTTATTAPIAHGGRASIVLPVATPTPTASPSPAAPVRPDHVVIVVLANGSGDPFLASLPAGGATFPAATTTTAATGQPACPSTGAAPNLATPLASIGRKFSEYNGCAHGLARFPTNFARLPAVAWVVPTTSDWLAAHLGPYARWARTHNSLLIVVSGTGAPLAIHGAHVTAGVRHTAANRYSVVRLVEDLYGLPCQAKACHAKRITGVGRG